MRFHHFIPESEGWSLVEDKVQFANPYLEIHGVLMTSPARSKPFDWTVCHRKGAVVIVPVTAEGKFVMVRQERVPIRRELWEFPAGQIDDIEEEDAIRATGLREMEEEVGYQLGSGGEVISLGHFFPSASFTDEHSHLIMASPVVPSPHGNKPDVGEAIVGTGTFTLPELEGMIASGEICDANTLAAYARLATLGLLKK